MWTDYSREVGLVPLDVRYRLSGRRKVARFATLTRSRTGLLPFGASRSLFNGLWMNLKIAVQLVVLVTIFAAGVLHGLGPIIRLLSTLRLLHREFESTSWTT
jgi:hypothetical protein